MEIIRYTKIENISQYKLLMRVWNKPTGYIMSEKWWLANLPQGAIIVFIQPWDGKLSWAFRLEKMEGYEYVKLSFEEFLLKNLNKESHD